MEYMSLLRPQRHPKPQPLPCRIDALEFALWLRCGSIETTRRYVSLAELM